MGWTTMRDEQALARVRELEAVIGRLQKVRDAVSRVNVSAYEHAGAGLWAGQKRNQFKQGFDAAKSSHSRIGQQIEQAIDDCKSKQRSLAYSINVLEHPVLAAEALAVALG